MIATRDTAVLSPLPQRYLTTTPGVGGRIKVRPEDFLVDEVPLYDPSGQGEHLYLGIEKTNVAHAELMSALKRHFGVSERAIGFAGMKDKAAITRQAVSIHLPGREPRDVEINHARIRVLWAKRHGNKLRRGHLRGNRFSIRIRDVSPTKAPAVMAVMDHLEKFGSPNAFGSQRFGYRRNNHLIGAALLGGDFDAAARLLLGAGDSPYPPFQKKRREAFDAGRLEEAAALWTTADRSERVICTAMARGKPARQAFKLVGRTAYSFWISAVQSAMFNRALDWRIDDGLLDKLVVGDLAWRHDSNNVFRITAEEFAKEELAGRAASLELSPTGPLWGHGMTRAGGEVDQKELAVLEDAGLSLEQMERVGDRMEGGRRPLRVPVRDVQVEGGVDEHGEYIRLAFDLPRGAYATVVMREVMKSDAAESDVPPDQPGDHDG